MKRIALWLIGQFGIGPTFVILTLVATAMAVGFYALGGLSVIYGSIMSGVAVFLALSAWVSARSGHWDDK